MQTQRHQQPYIGTQMQYSQYTHQFPSLPNVPLVNPLTSATNHNTMNVIQPTINPYVPPPSDSPSDEETLAVNIADQNSSSTWQIIKKRKHFNDQPYVDASFKLPICNRFKDLQPEETQGMDVHQPSTPDSSTAQPVEPRPPPIHIQGVTNFQAMTANLAAVAPKDSYHTKSLANNTVTVYPHSSVTYRSLVTHLRNNNIAFHTYQLKQDRAYRVVLRDIHYSIPTQDIVDELATKGHQVRNITNIRHRVTKEPLPLFFVDLEPQPNNKEIYDLHHIFHSKIRVEPPRPKKTTIQCTRCQEYGHSKTYCNKPYYCVKCGQQHDSKTCTKTRDTPATCALCQGKHPANYKGCSVYRDLTTSKNNRFPRPLPPPQTKTNTTLTPPSPQILTTNQNPLAYPTPTYTQIASPSTPPTLTDHNSQFGSFLHEFKTMFSQLLQQNTTIMTLLTTLINNFTK